MAPFPSSRFFGFDEVADVRIFADFAARTKVGEGADPGAIRNGAFGEDAALPHEYVIAQRAVFDYRVGSDLAVCSYLRFAEELHIRLDDRVWLDLNLGVNHARVWSKNRDPARP